MAVASSFGWQQWGKPDKATCSWMVSRMPDDIRLALNKSEREVLEWILFFTWKGASTGKTANTSTFLSQMYVSENIGKSRWTVARALDRLEEYGLVRSLKRLKSKAGEWKPRLLTLIGRLVSFLSYLSGNHRPKSPGCKTAPHEYKHSNKSETTSSFGSSLTQERSSESGNAEFDRAMAELAAYEARTASL